MLCGGKDGNECSQGVKCNDEDRPEDLESKREAKPIRSTKPRAAMISKQCKERNNSGGSSLLPTSLPPDLLLEHQFAYDTAVHDLAGAVRRVLRLPTDQALGLLHQSEEATAHKMLNKGRTVKPCRNIFIRRWNSTFGGGEDNRKGTTEEERKEAKEACQNFVDVYKHFVHTVAVKEMHGEPLIYQAQPTFRCSHPGQAALGHRHCDADYCHQPNEVNFWLPLSPVYDTNSLWVESAPGLHDFKPIEAQPGEGFRFYGNQCEHYTCPNTTEHTRISLDFRVVPAALYDPEYKGKSWKVNFKLGNDEERGWYSSTAAESSSMAVQPTSDGASSGIQQADSDINNTATL